MTVCINISSLYNYGTNIEIYIAALDTRLISLQQLEYFPYQDCLLKTKLVILKMPRQQHMLIPGEDVTNTEPIRHG